MYMRHAQELLIHYESTKYIYGQKNNVFRYEKSKSLFQNVPPQCIQFCTVNKITTVYVFFNWGNVKSENKTLVCMVFELNEQQANHYYLDLRE